jgi:hypothetical protein
MWIRKITSLMIAFFLMLISALGHSIAAVQGSLSGPNANSFGSKQVTVFIKARVRVSGFEDFEVADWKIGDGDIDHSDDLCVYANNAAGYKVIPTSTNFSFNLRSVDNSHDLAYALTWNDGTNDTPLSYASSSPAFTNHSYNSASCSGGTNSALKLKITATDLQATPGVDNAYIDVVTLTVLPV